MKMALTLDTLKDLDFGKVEVAFLQHLKRAVEDCMDRSGDNTGRKVILTFDVKPQQDQSGQCEFVDLECQISSKVPAHRSRTFQCRPRKGGHLEFESDTPEDFNQHSLSEEAQRQQKEPKNYE